MTKAERDKLILQDWLNNVPRKEIRKKYHIVGISPIVKGHPRKMVGRINKSEVISMHNIGLTHYQIAEKLNSGARYIADLLKSMGIKPYKIKRARKIKSISQEKPKFIREELPPRLEALREKYKKMEVINESNQTFRIRIDDLPFNVRPKYYHKNYSRIAI